MKEPWALGGPSFERQPDTDPGITVRTELWTEVAGKPVVVGVYASYRLNFARIGQACEGQPRSEPDSGNPTVRDRREACGNVGYGKG